MAVPKRQAVAIAITLLVYVIHLILSGLAASGGNTAFPHSAKNASERFQLEITPVWATFSIWGVIFTYQLIWLLYTMTTIYRSGEETNILSTQVFICFFFYVILITLWLFFWTRYNVVGMLVSIVVGQMFLQVSIGFACSDLRDYLVCHAVSARNKIDVWCQRILVQNGLFFNATWTMIATVVNASIFISYELGTSTSTASLIGLAILGVLVITWFILESWVLAAYTEYIFTNYIVLLVALVGIFKNIRGKEDETGVTELVIGLLAIVSLFFVIRIIVICVHLMRNINSTVDTEVTPKQKLISTYL